MLIRPKSLSQTEMQDILEIVDLKFIEIFPREISTKADSLKKFYQRTGDFPDPLKKKVTTEWFYHQLSDGAFLYRFSIDGRRETRSGRVNSAIEGAYLNGIDIEKSIRVYRKKGKDIIREIGKQIPSDMEKFLVGANFDIFRQLFRNYSNSGNLDSLYNHFYVACYGKEIKVNRFIDIPPLCKINRFGKNF